MARRGAKEFPSEVHLFGGGQDQLGRAKGKLGGDWSTGFGWVDFQSDNEMISARPGTGKKRDVAWNGDRQGGGDEVGMIEGGIG